MGLYNYQLERLPAPLNEKRCFVCDSQMTPYNKDTDKDAFQYKCNNCNANVVIEISGSLLASTLYSKLRNRIEARGEIHEEIRNWTEIRYPITTTLASRFLKIS